MRIWIVEMLVEKQRGPAKWEPTVDVGFTKAGAEAEAQEWRYRNPTKKFLVRAYVPEGKR